MTNFAIYKDDLILNVIVADSKEIAEQVTGMKAIQTEGEPWMGWTLENDEWKPPVQPEPEVEPELEIEEEPEVEPESEEEVDETETE
jgi:hypothetical protein